MYRATHALKKNIKTRIFSFSSVLVLAFNGLVVASPLLLSKTAYASVPTTLYVNASWAGATPGSDPDGAGPATNFGVDSFSTIQSAVSVAGSNDTVEVAAGNYEGFSLNGRTDLTIKGAGVGTTYIKPTTLIDSGTTHKYTTDMKVSVLVKDSSNVALQDMTIEGNGATPGAGGADALVFWDASTGSIDNSNLTGTYAISGAQTGQGIAVDASVSQAVNLTVNNSNISGFQKNGIDIIDGNGGTSASDTINVAVNGGSITGAGSTSTIAQNGIVAWNRGGGTLTGSVNGTTINDFEYAPSTDYATGILVYGGASFGPVVNASFNNDDYYVAATPGGGSVDATSGNTFDGVSPATATNAQLGAVQDKLLDAMNNTSYKQVYILPNSAIATTNPDNLGIQAAIDLVGSGDTVYVAPGDYTHDVTVNSPVNLVGPNAAVNPNTGSRTTEATVTGQVKIYSGDVSFKGFTVTNPSWNSVTVKGLYIYSAGSVINNITAQNNIFTDIDNTAHGSYGVMVQGVTNNVKLLDNKVTNIHSAGWAHGIEVTPTGGSATVPQNTTITGNVVSNITNPSQTDAYAFSADSASYNSNPIYADASQITLTGNSLLNDVRNLDTSHVLNATGNWWGSATGPTDTVSGDSSITDTNPGGTGSKALGAIKYLPWCTDASCAQVNNQTAPTLLSPLNGSYLHNAGTLDWSDVPGAVGYQYQSAHSGATNPDNSLTSPIYTNSSLTASQIDASGTANGTYYWQARAKFGDNTYGPWASPWKLTVDTIKPSTPNITAPSNGQYFSGTPIVDSWSASTDNLSGIQKYQVWYIYDDGHSFSGSTCADEASGACRDVSGSTTTRNHTPALSEQGGVTIRVRAVDGAGNVGDWSSPVHYYYDAIVLSAPTLSSPANNAVVNGATLTNSWSAVSNATQYEYESFNSSDTSATPRYDHNYTATHKVATNVADGTVFYWRVRAIDQYGNTGPWSSLWKVTVDNTAPVVHITAPVAGSVKGTVTISGTVTDANPDHYYLVVKDSHGTVVAGPGTVNAHTVADYSWDTSILPDGVYTINLAARDAAGNRDASSAATTTVTVDNTAPTTPVASPTGNSSTSPEFVSLSSTDNSGDTPSIYYTLNGSTPDNSSTLYTGAIYVPGTETIKAVAYDGVGNISHVMTETYTITPPPSSSQQQITFSSVNSGAGGGANPQNAGGGTGGAGGAGGGAQQGTTPQVLGATTTTPSTDTSNNNDSQVKGLSTLQKANKPDTINNSNFLGLGWWWLLVIGFLAMLLWAVLGRRKSSNQ